MLQKKKLLGVGITNATINQILEYILKSIEKSNEKYYITTPNPEILVLANKDNHFKNILNSAQLALPDGVGVILAGKILGKSYPERVTGADLLGILCRSVAKRPITVGFLGAGPGVAVQTAECLRKKYTGLKVVFAASEWPVSSSKFNPSASFRTRVQNSKRENQSKIPNTKYQIPNTIDILFVAFGFPKQEEWISQNLPKIPVKVAIGVGGAFDYVCGRVPRAPLWMQEMGLEWLYRLFRQPWRIKRQLALVEFAFLVIKEKLRFSLTSKTSF